MARTAIDTLSTYYRTLNEPVREEGGSSRILSALTRSDAKQLQFDVLRRETELTPVELATTLRTLQDLKLVTIQRLGNDDEVAITLKGKSVLGGPLT